MVLASRMSLKCNSSLWRGEDQLFRFSIDPETCASLQIVCTFVILDKCWLLKVLLLPRHEMGENVVIPNHKWQKVCLEISSHIIKTARRMKVHYIPTGLSHFCIRFLVSCQWSITVLWTSIRCTYRQFLDHFDFGFSYQEESRFSWVKQQTPWGCSMWRKSSIVLLFNQKRWKSSSFHVMNSNSTRFRSKGSRILKTNATERAYW